MRLNIDEFWGCGQYRKGESCFEEGRTGEEHGMKGRRHRER